MAVWLVRAGSHGEFEQKFLDEKRIYLTWDGLDVDLSQFKTRNDLRAKLQAVYPKTKPNVTGIWVGQIWTFVHEMKKGDLVVLPSKIQRVIHVGEIAGDYEFVPNGPNPFFHRRSCKWVGESIPRSNFPQDLLYSFGSLLTICRIQRNDAETRLKRMRENGWKPESGTVVTGDIEGIIEEEKPTDLEDTSGDQIVKLLGSRFKGHGLARLVEAILRAQGYTTYLSPEGADGGADILAGTGPLGFNNPQLCVEVKSGESPVDRPTVDKLLGAMTKFGAAQGLFVSWSGFKRNVQKELAPSFFRLRLWTQKELLENLFASYDKLDADLKAELPLKKIWTVAAPEDE